MPHKLIISEEAQQDIFSALNYYSSINLRLKKKFLNELRKVQNYIKNNPEKFQIRYGEIRICFLKAFPYGVHYKIIKNTVVIFAVFHTSEDSNKWKIRK